MDDESAQESLQSVQKYASQSAKGTLESHVLTDTLHTILTCVGSLEYALHHEYFPAAAALDGDTTNCTPSTGTACTR